MHDVSPTRLQYMITYTAMPSLILLNCRVFLKRIIIQRAIELLYCKKLNLRFVIEKFSL